MRASAPPSSLAARLENLLTWFGASVLITAGLIYAVKQDDDRRRPGHDPGFGGDHPAREPLAWQETRALQRGRGRSATVPARIPWRGWKDIIVRTYHEIQDDRLLALAAGVVFYSLVALFPAIAAGVASYALFADAGTISMHLSLVSDIVPASV